MTGDYEDGGAQPDNCDCCGRDAEDCRMGDLGWVVREEGDDLSGSYCLQCAAALRLLPWFERCAICEATVDDDEIDDAAIDWESVEGAGWAQHDPQIGVDYAGQWVVAIGKKVVASGPDPDTARAAAAARLNRDPRSLMACSISHPNEWMLDG